jgi:hypothetical protein
MGILKRIKFIKLTVWASVLRRYEFDLNDDDNNDDDRASYFTIKIENQVEVFVLWRRVLLW